MSERALYFVGQLGTGGHVRTALTYASALRARGWTVTFCGSDCGGAGLVLESGFPLISVEPVVYGEFFSSPQAVRDAVSVNPHVVHSFDLASLPCAASVARLSDAKLVHTICGGKAPWYPLPMWDGLVVMSEELADIVANQGGRRPRVIRGRIRFGDRIAKTKRPELRRRLSIEEDACVALMISRTCATKMRSLRTFVAVVAALAERDARRRWRGLICGSADDQLLRSELDDLCHAVNSRFGRTVISCDTSFNNYAFEVLPVADVFMGVGDAFAEAAANGIPALVMGETGYAGILSQDSEPQLYRFNLSGRNAVSPESPEKTADRVMALLHDDALRASAVEFARSSVLTNLSVDGAVAEYENLYRARTLAGGIPRRALLALRILFRIRKWYLTWVPARVRLAVLRARGLA